VRSFSLNKKLGLLYLGVLALLAGVCAVVVLQLVSMREDADRLLEESRELALAKDLDAHFESIDMLLRLRTSNPEDEVVHDLLETQLADVRAILTEMDAGPEHGDDPSRLEHQNEELELTGTIQRGLRVLDKRIDSPSELDAEEHAMVARMRQVGQELRRETDEEAEHATDDLRARSRRAVRTMAWTVVLVALALSATLLLVLRAVVFPLRALRQRAEAVARGEFEHAPASLSRDEIGDLARAFHDMARQVAATQGALEERVATRTRELARAARYADLGVLAAGVAHEINNPLASIASCAEGLHRRLERGTLAPEQQGEYLRTITSEAYRARDITQRLLTLARHEPAVTSRVPLAPLFEELERVTRHQLEQRGIKLLIDAEEHVIVHGNSGELLQALVNLVLNARDACRTGGTVHVSVARAEGAVVIDVDDDGPGVPPELVERIFEPFFTTKGPGQGTGLGLSLVAAVVEGHKGTVAVSRSPAGGARFRLRIPLHGEAVDGAA